MIAVRVGEAWRCACVWTTKAITEANTAVMTTAKSTGASGIRRKEKSPSPASAGTGASMAHTSATTPSCTAARTTGSSPIRKPCGGQYVRGQSSSTQQHEQVTRGVCAFACAREQEEANHSQSYANQPPTADPYPPNETLEQWYQNHSQPGDETRIGGGGQAQSEGLEDIGGGQERPHD